MKTTIGKFLSALVLVSLLAGALALSIPSGSVAAQGTQPPTTPTVASGGASATNQAQQTTRLENLFQREEKLAAAQTQRFTALDERLAKVQARIDKLKGAGKDVSALEKALTDFKDEISAARTAHASAQDILNQKAGFDANGKVTNLKQAQDTVKEAGQLLKQVHQDLRPALRDLIRTIRQYLRDNRKV